MAKTSIVGRVKRWISVSETDDRYPLNVAQQEELGYSSQAPEAEREILRLIASDMDAELREMRQRESRWKTAKADAEQRCQQLEQVAREMLGRFNALRKLDSSVFHVIAQADISDDCLIFAEKLQALGVDLHD